MKESLYALPLVLLLVVTKASIKIAHNLASEVHQREKTERKPSCGTQMAPCVMKSDETNNATFTHKTNQQRLKIKGDIGTQTKPKVSSQQEAISPKES